MSQKGGSQSTTNKTPKITCIHSKTGERKSFTKPPSISGLLKLICHEFGFKTKDLFEIRDINDNEITESVYPTCETILLILSKSPHL
jgi:hypothetical protein